MRRQAGSRSAGAAVSPRQNQNAVNAMARYSGAEKSHGAQNGMIAGWSADSHQSTAPTATMPR